MFHISDVDFFLLQKSSEHIWLVQCVKPAVNVSTIINFAIIMVLTLNFILDINPEASLACFSSHYFKLQNFFNEIQKNPKN